MKRLALLLALTTTAAADPSQCTVANVKQVRKRASALMKAKQYSAAAEALGKLDCYLDPDQPMELQRQLAWRMADLSWALHKAGNDSLCYAIAARESTPYAGNVAAIFDNERVLAALEANADACHAAEADRRGTFSDPTPCTLSDDAIGVPTLALAPGDRAACLMIEPGQKDEEDTFQCGDVTLVHLTTAGRLAFTKLAPPEDSNLVDQGVCCNLHEVKFARHGNALAFLAVTGGRNCDGGTASSSEEQVYELARDGKTLKIVHSLDVGYH